MTLSPQYGSINTITTELDQLRVTINSASLALGTNSAHHYRHGRRHDATPAASGIPAAGLAPTSSPPPVGGITPPPPSPPSSSTKLAMVTWAPNGEPDLVGYKLYIGTASVVYSQTIDVRKVTSYAIALPKGVTYFFCITAYDSSGHENEQSAELSRSVF
jgi:hypothetical protein